MTEKKCYEQHFQFANGQPVASIVLDSYELINLRTALEAIMQDRGPLNALNSGDWVGQIYNKLPKPEDATKYYNVQLAVPNRSVESYKQLAKQIGDVQLKAANAEIERLHSLHDCNFEGCIG